MNESFMKIKYEIVGTSNRCQDEHVGQTRVLPKDPIKKKTLMASLMVSTHVAIVPLAMFIKLDQIELELGPRHEYVHHVYEWERLRGA